MKKEGIHKGQTCPLCGNIYFEAPAVSRTDGKTSICTDCGTRQSLHSIGVPKDEQDKILAIIHQYINRQEG